MTACPACRGDGEHDHRDSDAWFSEHHTDAQIDAMRARGLVHPAGVTVCPTCEGTGLLPDDVAEAMLASAAELVRGLIAKWDAE